MSVLKELLNHNLSLDNVKCKCYVAYAWRWQQVIIVNNFKKKCKLLQKNDVCERYSIYGCGCFVIPREFERVENPGIHKINDIAFDLKISFSL